MNSFTTLKKRSISVIIFVIMMIAVTTQISCLVDPSTPVGTIEHYALHSKIVGDDYDISVRFPPDYQKDNGPYPVIFQLDPQWQFNITEGFIAAYEQKDTNNRVIVVGIGYPYPSGGTYTKGRNRDYTLPIESKNYPYSAEGGAVNFYRFIREELIPYLEQTISMAGPQHRALIGHSYGGLFTLYALSQYDSASPCISNFLAASPSLWYDNWSVLKNLESLRSRYTDIPVSLYMSVGTLEGASMIEPFDYLAKEISSGTYKDSHYKFEKFPADHEGNVVPSYESGIRFLMERGL